MSESVEKAVSVQRNSYAVAGLVLGIVSVFFYQIGILPLAGIALSVVGLVKAKDYAGKGTVQATIGLILSCLYTILYLRFYGHIYTLLEQ